MRNKLIAFALAVLAMVAIVVVAIVATDDDAETPPNSAAASPTPSASRTAAATTTAAASPTPQARSPTFAPDGRTGIPEVDRITDDFLTLNAAELLETYPRLVARPGGEDRDVPAEEWTARLAAAERNLYAVSREREGARVVPPREIDIVLRVTEPGATAVGWRIGVDGGEIVELVIGSGPSDIAAYIPSVEGFYELFLVLPPLAELPQAPSSHVLATTTGDANVDALLALIATGNNVALSNAAPAPLARTTCGDNQEQREDVARRELGEIVDQAISLHSVAELPEGYLPSGDHIIILVLEVSPYRWYAAGLLERAGNIVGVDICETVYPALLYPPLSYPVPPVVDLDPSLRSGIEVIDTFLDALAEGNLDAMLELVIYKQIGCIVEPVGIGGPPFCEGSEAKGTILDVLPAGQCEGYYIRRAGVGPALDDLTDKPWALYAVVEPGPALDPDSLFFHSMWQAVLVNTDLLEDGVFDSLSLWLDAEGLAALSFGCGPTDPAQMLSRGTGPAFLLPPP